MFLAETRGLRLGSKFGGPAVRYSPASPVRVPLVPLKDALEHILTHDTSYLPLSCSNGEYGQT